MIQFTSEMRRILALPRRQWPDVVDEMTEALRRPGGTMRLRPVQAVALLEAALYGLFGPIPVGEGKTLISLLLPTVVGAERPLLLLPAKLVDKTRRAIAELNRHWLIPDIRIMSYQLLGCPQSEDALEAYAPDCLPCDEAHRLKNRRAAVTRRVFRYLARHPGARIYPMSGTIVNRAIADYHHIVCHALPEPPLPRGEREALQWGEALDPSDVPADVGALRMLCRPDETGLEGARRAYRRRLVDTPGVVAPETRGECGASISIAAFHVDPPRAAFARLRSAWELPDGHPLASGLEVRRHAYELALGLWYRWDPPAPKEWLAARQAWCRQCRYILSTNRRDLDSEVPVINAVDRGLYPEAAPALAAWRAIKATFEPVTVPVWVDDRALEACARWAKEPGILWTSHVLFAQRLAEYTGLPYYREQGRDARGRPIPEYPDGGDTAVIASIDSVAEGFNLQRWSRNLVLAPPANNQTWQQLLGRTHRAGQTADEVTFDVLVTVREHAEGIAKALSQGAYVESTTGQPQKINLADIDIPEPESLA